MEDEHRSEDTSLTPDVVTAAEQWAHEDPDDASADALRQLVGRAREGDVGALQELTEAMGGPLEFGTAGLRGVVGPGCARMNVATVTRAARGLGEVLLKRADARQLPVIVGYDGRTHSRRFAEVTVGVLTALKIPVRYFPAPIPTPLVAYAARQLGASAAVVVTASHNPPEYNGFKVYAANGVQIVPPLEGEISSAIRAVGPANAVPVDAVELVSHDDRSRAAAAAAVTESWAPPGVDPADPTGLGQVRAAGGPLPRTPLAEPVPAPLVARYIDELNALRTQIIPGGAGADRTLKIVYTPMHGVGWSVAERALNRAGYFQIFTVDQQLAIDGTFPTVNFPNPEEPGALDLAMARAREVGADVIFANDPDADRLSVTVPTVTGRWVPLTGNQVGLLLGEFLLERSPRHPRPLVVSSIVSSPLLAEIARAYQARHETTFTGFKWIWNAALAIQKQESVSFLFGYEEALGYSVGPMVRDKDGITAAVLMADLAAHCRHEGITLQERLERLYRTFGVWVSRQKSIVMAGVDGQAKMEAAMARLRAEPPTEVAGHGVASIVDYASDPRGQRPPWRSTANLLELRLEGGSRVLVRPSGTEPKLKLYVDLKADVPEDVSVRKLEDDTLAVADELASAVAAAAGLAG